MPQKLAIPEGFGLAEVEVAGLPPVQLDLWEAENTYAALRFQHQGDALAVYSAFRDWLAERGLPGLSHGAVEAVVLHVQEAVGELKKKGPFSPTPASAASTDSTAPNSQAP